MLKSQRGYEKAMRSMLRRVHSSESLQSWNPHKMSVEDAEILMDCIKAGYLIGTTESDGAEHRTLDGKAHPELLSTSITPNGFAFLKPKRTDLKATVAIWLSIFAFIFSTLATLDKIVENYHWLANGIKAIITKG